MRSARWGVRVRAAFPELAAHYGFAGAVEGWFSVRGRRWAGTRAQAEARAAEYDARARAGKIGTTMDERITYRARALGSRP